MSRNPLDRTSITIRLVPSTTAIRTSVIGERPSTRRTSRRPGDDHQPTWTPRHQDGDVSPSLAVAVTSRGDRRDCGHRAVVPCPTCDVRRTQSTARHPRTDCFTSSLMSSIRRCRITASMPGRHPVVGHHRKRSARRVGLARHSFSPDGPHPRACGTSTALRLIGRLVQSSLATHAGCGQELAFERPRTRRVRASLERTTARFAFSHRDIRHPSSMPRVPPRHAHVPAALMIIITHDPHALT
jgi:hypothetical protein